MTAGGPLTIVILHGVADASRPDEKDTLDQAAQLDASLTRLGHRVVVRPLALDLSALECLPPDALVFNLVEAIRSDGRLIHLAPAALEHLGRAYTGAGPAAMVLSSSKTLAKPVLRAAGLEVPQALRDPEAHSDKDFYIVKSEWEDASFGLDAGSVVERGRAAAEIEARQARYGGAWFAERFIDGREFNISVLGHGEVVRVLPPAEIVFQDYPEGRPRIVDYEAKWDASSFAYRNTVRRFLDSENEPELAERLANVARRAYAALDLRDYGRVDIRLSDDGTPYVLEVNANPCLSADAGFSAAAAEAGLGYDAMIGEIVDSARRRLIPGVRPFGSDTSIEASVAPALSRDRSKESDPESLIPGSNPGLPADSGLGRAASEAAGAAHAGISTSDVAAAPPHAPKTPGSALPADRPWRFEAEEADAARVRALVGKTGFFTDTEVDIAAELVTERLAKGPASGYEFVLHEHDGRLAGYTCFGLIPGSDVSYDLYWIAVDPELQGQGLGRRLLDETLGLIRATGGRHLYADTSSSPRYAPTRAYYVASGFREAARLDDFYRDGDGKVIYVRDV